MRRGPSVVCVLGLLPTESRKEPPIVGGPYGKHRSLRLLRIVDQILLDDNDVGIKPVAVFVVERRLLKVCRLERVGIAQTVRPIFILVLP